MSFPPLTPYPALASFPAKLIFNGQIRGHYAHVERMTIGEVVIGAGTELPMHEHPHEQVTYVLEGEMQFTVGEQTGVLGPGQVALIPPGVRHGGRTLTACRLIDVFAPVREDYRS